MKSIDPTRADGLPGRRLAADEPFSFACGPELACFNRCCRNLNLFLYPYDVLRLKQRLGICAEAFLDTHTDTVLRPGHHFPDVLLRMADNAERTCPFVSPRGCTIYADRPFTCRSFPLEKGLMKTSTAGSAQAVFFLNPPTFCLGPQQPRTTTARRWFAEEADTRTYDRFTSRWAEIQSRFQQDPRSAGLEEKQTRMAFMAAYNLDAFRRFVFESTFLQRFRISPERKRRIERNDPDLLELGMEWIELFLWGIQGRGLRPRR